MKKLNCLICAACLALTGTAAALPAPLTALAESGDETVHTYQGMQYAIHGNAVTITGYTSDLPEVLVIPAEIGGLPVTAIGENAFEHCAALRSVTIPESVTAMEQMAFEDCQQLTEVILPKALKSIARYGFGDCNALEQIVIPEGIAEIEEHAFYSCDTLADITIPESVTEIGAGVFKDTAWLTAKRKENRLVIVNSILVDGQKCTGRIVIPDGVTKITELAFWKSGISGVQFPESLAEIGRRAFHSCELLRSVTIPATLKKCGDNVFMHCTGLTGVTLADGVTEIAGGEFRECKSLTSITIPEGVTKIGDYAFADSNSLAEIVIPDSVQEIGRRAFYKTAWLAARQEENPLVIVNHYLLDGTACEGDITVPDDVTVITEQAFDNAQALTGITIPEGIAEIGFNTFFYCPNLTRAALPQSIRSIGMNAFSGCEKLTDLTIPEQTESIGKYAFSDCDSLEKITVPASVGSIGMGAFNSMEKLTEITILNPDCEIYDAPDTICQSVPLLPEPMEKGEDDTPATESKSVFTGIIRGYENSTAQAYAEKYDYQFESLGAAPEPLTGDYNGDGVIGAEDAQRVLDAYVKTLSGSNQTLSERKQRIRDVNADGAVDVTDAQYILLYYVKNTIANNPVTWEQLLEN